jgi:Flp pilus assembly protein TadG
MVEMAVIMSLLITMALGVFEIGSVWSDHQVVTQAARSGARVGSQLGLAGEADHEILRAIEAGFGDLSGQITKVVVYEADLNGDMPAACATAAAGYNGPAHCNVYDATSLANLTVTAQWGSGNACGPADANWCSATDRVDDQALATFLGVYVEMERPYLTRFFGGDTHAMSEATVMRIEPGNN